MNFFTGFLVGVVSLVPGISGGTVLVIMKKYEEITSAIAHFKERKNKWILFLFVLGIFLGCLTFARIIELLFYFFPTGTMVLFCGFILFQLPSFIKSERISFRTLPFFLGAFFIYFLSLLSHQSEAVVFKYPPLSLFFLFSFALFGMVDGFFTILPGVSGSMVMMILGPYFLYKSYLAHLSFQTLVFLIPLFFYFAGDMFGFYLGSKFSLFCLKKYRRTFLNLVLGMVLMSVLILLPIPNWEISSLLFFLLPLSISFLLCLLFKRFN